jgi:N-acetylmuramoyl-L-alanine amidase
VSKLIKIKMELKRYFSLIILSVLLSVNPLFTQAQKVRKVVIDAGHGGHDPGAVGKTSKEKDIALSIALKTGKFIEENLPDVEVVYTRKTDVFVELYRRARIANEAKADLFISIHCNANKSTTPYGAETYVMGLHKSDANLAVAQTENASILLEDDYHVKYDGFDPTSPEGYIFFTMLQNAYLDQSLSLASNVQKHFRERVNLFDRGVKQAGFLVLYKTTMPSVLIETGFISNVKEEKILASDEGQTYIASAIFRAVKDYKRLVEKTPMVADKETVPDKPLVIKDTPASTVKETTQSTTSKPADQLIAQKDPAPGIINPEIPVIQVADNNTTVAPTTSASTLSQQMAK